MPKRVVSRILSDDQTEKLIAEIRSRPCLWNESDCNYKNSFLNKKLWHQIGCKINVSGSAARRKWKSMKDTFRKMQQKRYYSQSSAYSEQPKWKFYQHMLFTKGTPRSDKDPVKTASAQDDFTENSLQSELEEIATSDNDLSLPPFHNEANCTWQPGQNPQSVQHGDQPNAEKTVRLGSTSQGKLTETNAHERSAHRSKSKVERSQLRKEQMQLERQKTEAVLRLLNHNESDEDYHFLMSLTPYFRMLNPLEKLELRSKVQNCVMDAFRQHQVQTHNVHEAERIDNWIISTVESDKTTINNGEEHTWPKVEA